ncbi:MAG: TIGR04282 family arsenosugar biosynthesis glycosyltransferase [Chlorobium phaeobacteroides]|uniref:Glycosyltransferase n=1 Tax=Chlorobium phaeobacteroides (strain BS1) TaxID=331678 RepID=B3EPL5_CHLPB|nr:TIGR04282 family arsenosugar biosynthesis glycosyltransferase [Chlorobium phaeobacteroides]NEX14041.1 glycosyltransferase [Prosthecochloris sp.]
MDTPLLIIFTRNPEPGKVKTRLAAATGDAFALALYNRMRGITLKAALESGAELAVFYSDYLPENDCFLAPGIQAFLQEGDDLGSRMLHAFDKGFTEGYRRIALIGTDCPELTGETLRKAFALLNRHGAVIGPATDGGYYLIGMRDLLPDLFINREWSTSRVCNDALNILKQHGVDCALLQELSDIDTVEDLENFNSSRP